MPKSFRMAKGELTEVLKARRSTRRPRRNRRLSRCACLVLQVSAASTPSVARSNANLAVLEAWVAKTPWCGIPRQRTRPFARTRRSRCRSADPRVRPSSNDKGQRDFVKKFVAALEKEMGPTTSAATRPRLPGLRIWCGATVEAADLEKLTPWLDVVV